MTHLFTYGTLMFDQVWSRLINHEYRKAEGILHGFTRKAVINEHYPVIYPNEPSDTVEGILYFNLKDSDIGRLDDFEGEFYRRQQETIVIPGGTGISAEVYVLKDRYRHIASDDGWDPKSFLQQGLDQFSKNYFGFNSQ